jgi:UDPglucose 6-dehydrogenase
MRVSIVGSGYVGLVSGVCLAERGHQVVCVDADAARVAAIARGEPPFHEANLPELLGRHAGRRLRATADLDGAVCETDLTLIAVGTPFGGDGIDLSQVREAARAIGRSLRGKSDYHVVVVKSTVVPGTTEDVVLPLLERTSGRRAGDGLGIGMNPEFLREGSAVADFMHPDRLVLGGIDACTHAWLAELYADFDGVDVLRTDPRTAEMIKYASNALLATLISFSNEIGNLCAAVGGMDVADVMRGVHLDQRVSPILADGRRITPGITTYLESGCGFGGSCFPKDVQALAAYGRAAAVPLRLLEATLEVNAAQPHQVILLLRRHFDSLVGIRVAVLGLAFKPGTNDIRHSPGIAVARELRAAGAQVCAYDPVALGEAALVLGPDVELRDRMTAALADADALVIATRWDEFRQVPQILRELRRDPVCVDGRRMLAPDSVARYEGIGRAPRAPRGET